MDRWWTRHDQLDAHGPGWQSVRDGVGSDRGWPAGLRQFAALLWLLGLETGVTIPVSSAVTQGRRAICEESGA